MTNELELLRAANPVSLQDLPETPQGLYERVVSEQRRRRVPTGRILVAAVAAGAIALAVTLVPGRVADRSEMGVVELALAAVSDGPVLHAVIEVSDFDSTLIDLRSGQTTLEVPRAELWFDREQKRRRGRLTIGDSLVFDGVGEVSMLDPVLAGFTSRYREALESGEARVVGELTIDGRRAVLLRFTLEPGHLAQEVAVDPESYRPLQFRFVPGAGRDESWTRIVSIETIERNSRDFASPEQPFPRGGLAEKQGQVTVAEASTALGRPALWPGRHIDGVELRQIELLRVKTRWSDYRETTKPALVFDYGDSLKISIGLSAYEMPLVGPLPHQRVPDGKLRLMEMNRWADVWFGTLERDGLYLKFESPQRDLIVAAAKALRPLG
jgi:hypothetical protein